MESRDPIPLPPYKTGPRSRLYLANQVLLAAAEKLELPVEVLDVNESLMAFGRGAHRVLVHKEILPLNDRAVDWVFEHKWLAHKLLSRLDVPVPRTYLGRTWEEVRDAAERLGFPGRPVVVKPDRGSQGSGVSADIRSAEELHSAYEHARDFVRSRARPERFVVQEHRPGMDHRCFVLDGHMLAVSRRHHPKIVGDGTSTVRTHMEDHNRRVERRGEDICWGPFSYDRECRRMLKRAGLTLRSVPAAGREVRLRSNANGSMGAWSEDVTDDVSPYVKRLVERTAVAAGLAIAGVDVLSENIAGRTQRTARPVIVEINSPPTLLPHHYPLAGQPRQVAYDVVRALDQMAKRR